MGKRGHTCFCRTTTHPIKSLPACFCLMNDLRLGERCSIPSKAKAKPIRKISDMQFDHVRTLDHGIMRPAAACESCLRQHRFDLEGVAYRLATATPAPPLTNVAPNRGYEYHHFIQKLESQEPQTQNSVQPIHRQITSLQRRRRCRFAGLTPLTFHHYSCSEAIYQTYVRVVATMHQQESSTVTAPQNKTKMPGETPGCRRPSLWGRPPTVYHTPVRQFNHTKIRTYVLHHRHEHLFST